MIQQRDVVPVLERIAIAFERIAEAIEPFAKLAIEALEEDRTKTVPANEVTRIQPPRGGQPPRVMRPRPPRQP